MTTDVAYETTFEDLVKDDEIWLLYEPNQSQSGFFTVSADMSIFLQLNEVYIE